MIYKIVQQIGGRFVETNPEDIWEWAQANCRPIRTVEKSPARRAELQGQPHIAGLVGPMFDGYKNNEAVIRYEDGPTNEFMSR